MRKGTVTGRIQQASPWVVGAFMLSLLVTSYDPAHSLDSQWPTLATLIVALGLAVGLLVVFSRLLRRKQLAQMRKRGSALFAPSVLVTSNEGLESRASGRTGRTPWGEVRGYAETPGHVFIMLDGLLGYVVPKRALPQETGTAFLEELERYARRIH